MVSATETHDPKGQETKIYTILKAGGRSTAATQTQSPAVVKSNMFLKVECMTLSKIHAFESAPMLFITFLVKYLFFSIQII